MYAGFDFAFDNSAKWSDEDIRYHAEHPAFKDAVANLLSRRHH